jgi:hypothetical protein
MPSLEVRWFFPQAERERPAVFNSADAAPTRVDWYAPCNAASGVKLREGNLEVKLLLQEHGTWEFAAGHCRGAVGLWNKWIYRNEAQTPPTAKTFQQASWIAVEKRRWLLKFENRNGNMVPTDTYATNGCQAEWTELVLDGTPWLSICLEAAGDVPALEDTLRKTAELVLPSLSEQLPLDEAHSRSYPQWLQDVAER